MTGHKRGAALLVLLHGLTGSACAGSRFAQLSTEAAGDDLQACASARVTEVKGWAYRVEGCGEEPRFVRCWYKRRSFGAQCCERMSEEDVLAVFGADDVHDRPQPALGPAICD